LQDVVQIGGHSVNRSTVGLSSLRQTGAVMRDMVVRYCTDIPAEMVAWSAKRFFRHVANLPFRDDPQEIESVARPAFTLDPDWEGPRDCDDKAVLIGAWLYLRKIPFRFLAVAYEPFSDVEHAVVECHPADADPFIIDATYHYIQWPNEGPYYNEQPITGWIK